MGKKILPFGNMKKKNLPSKDSYFMGDIDV